MAREHEARSHEARAAALLGMVLHGLRQAGLPAPVAAAYASCDEGIARGTLAVTSGTVAELTGSPPQSVPAYLSAHRAELLAAR